MKKEFINDRVTAEWLNYKREELVNEAFQKSGKNIAELRQVDE